MVPAFTTVTAPRLAKNPVIPAADRAAALIGDAVAREEENAFVRVVPRDSAGIDHGHGVGPDVNPVNPADRAAALVDDAATREEENADAVRGVPRDAAGIHYGQALIDYLEAVIQPAGRGDGRRIVNRCVERDQRRVRSGYRMGHQSILFRHAVGRRGRASVTTHVPGSVGRRISGAQI
jgi:hypothetical protein